MFTWDISGKLYKRTFTETWITLKHKYKSRAHYVICGRMKSAADLGTIRVTSVLMFVIQTWCRVMSSYSAQCSRWHQQCIVFTHPTLHLFRLCQRQQHHLASMAVSVSGLNDPGLILKHLQWWVCFILSTEISLDVFCLFVFICNLVLFLRPYGYLVSSVQLCFCKLLSFWIKLFCLSALTSVCNIICKTLSRPGA